MRILNYFIVSFVFAVGLLPSIFASQPTFADLSVFLAKGHFRNEVPANATLEQCAAFLNSQGVCFSLFDLMDSNAVVTKEDCARVVGQSALLFLGEAELLKGCIKKPKKVETWVDYCLLNDVDSRIFWRGFLHRMEKGHLPEVQRFFGNGLKKGE